MKVMDAAAHSLFASASRNDTKKLSTLSTSTTMQRVHCPTCGSTAERYYLADVEQVRTQCACCDYLMVLCARTGRVMEAYAPSFAPALSA